MSALTDYILNNEPQFKSRSRLISLYSDFSYQKSVNADGYSNNVTIWIKALEDAARRGLCPGPKGSNDLLILHAGRELTNELEIAERGRPMALGVVVKEGIASRQIIPLQDFLGQQSSIYDQGWATSSWNYISRTLRELAVEGFGLHSLGASPMDAPEGVVLLSNVEEAGKQVESQIEKTANLIERVYARDAFQERFRRPFRSGGELTEADFEILLKFLARDRRLIAYNSKIVRVLNSGESDTVNSQDDTIATLKTLLENLDRQIKQLSDQIEICQSKAREAVAKKNRNKALMLLRSKKIAEEQLSQRSETWFQMKAVYDKIAQAIDQVQVLKAMENSATVLRQLHDQIGGTERVEDIVDTLNEEISKTDEIGDAMNEPGNRVLIDNEEIEQELDALLEEQGTKAEQNQPDKRLAELPDLPVSAETGGRPNTLSSIAVIEGKKADKGVEESTSQLRQLELGS